VTPLLDGLRVLDQQPAVTVAPDGVPPSEVIEVGRRQFQQVGVVDLQGNSPCLVMVQRAAN